MQDSSIVFLIRRIRILTGIFIAGLVLSGATAIPVPFEVETATEVLGKSRWAGVLPQFMADWFRTLLEGIRTTSVAAPFMFYGTDWLAFGHFAIAVAFLGALRDPVRNRWLYQFGMVACGAVPFWALAFGHLRGIPPWWRLIDSCFGFAGFVPVYLCHRWCGVLERSGMAAGGS